MNNGESQRAKTAFFLNHTDKENTDIIAQIHVKVICRMSHSLVQEYRYNLGNIPSAVKVKTDCLASQTFGMAKILTL